MVYYDSFQCLDTIGEGSSWTESILSSIVGGGGPKPLIEHLFLQILYHLDVISGIVGLKFFWYHKTKWSDLGIEMVRSCPFKLCSVFF